MTSFFTDIGQEIVSGIALGSIYALIALGFILIYKATEVVNFAQGELMMVGAYVNFFPNLYRQSGCPNHMDIFIWIVGFHYFCSDIWLVSRFNH